MRVAVSRSSDIFPSSDSKPPVDCAVWDQEIFKGSGGWVIVLDDLDHLIRMVDQYGGVIVQRGWIGDDPRMIELEIYDDFRE